MHTYSTLQIKKKLKWTAKGFKKKTKKELSVDERMQEAADEHLSENHEGYLETILGFQELLEQSSAPTEHEGWETNAADNTYAENSDCVDEPMENSDFIDEPID